MDHEYKEVYFEQYCCFCEHWDTKENENPCEECLDNPTNFQSHKPINYEEKSSSK